MAEKSENFCRKAKNIHNKPDNLSYFVVLFLYNAEVKSMFALLSFFFYFLQGNKK